MRPDRFFLTQKTVPSDLNVLQTAVAGQTEKSPRDLWSILMKKITIKMNRLHDLKKFGDISNSVLPWNLGQIAKICYNLLSLQHFTYLHLDVLVGFDFHLPTTSYKPDPFQFGPVQLIGTLSNDNRDGDGNATGSGKTQKVHCA